MIEKFIPAISEVDSVLFWKTKKPNHRKPNLEVLRAKPTKGIWHAPVEDYYIDHPRIF